MKNNNYLLFILIFIINISFAQTTAGEYTAEVLEMNSKNSDFGSTFYDNDKIIFSSARRKTRKKWQGNNQSFLDLYEGTIQEDGTIDDVKRFSIRVNSQYHESSVSFSPDQKTVYFSRNNYINRKLAKDNNGVTNIAMYRADVDSHGNWRNIKAMPFNSKDYSVGHPTVSNDGKKLYFTSDMPGSLGLTDIFTVDILNNGKFSEPKNLGSKVNTIGKEMFPYIDNKNILYFSSDSRNGGFGGLDVYAVKIYKRSVSEVLHLGKPINSDKDDFSYILSNKNNQGYFSSNREEGIGDDDIYHFTASPPLHIECSQPVDGIVQDKKTKKPIANALITLFNEEGSKVKTVLSDINGKYSFNVDCGAKYAISGTKDNYELDKVDFTTEDDPSAIAALELNLKYNAPIIEKPKPAVVVVPEPVVVVKPEPIKPKPNFEEIEVVRNKVVIRINPIYFALNSSAIRKDAAYELDKVVSIMRKYPQLRIEGGSHTDSRGSSVFNENLSAKRANSTVDYIIRHGIDPSRITARGYGESQIMNRCTNNVRCPEKEHEQNRRTEFVIQNPDVLGYTE